VSAVRAAEEVPTRRGTQGAALAIAGLIERWMAERHADVALLVARRDPATFAAMASAPPYETGWILRPASRTVVESANATQPTDAEWGALPGAEAGAGPAAVSVLDPNGVGRMLIIRELEPGEFLVLRGDIGPVLRPFMESFASLSVTGRSFVASRSGGTVTALEVDTAGTQLVHHVRMAEAPAAVRAALQDTPPPRVAEDFRGVRTYARTRHIPSLGWGVIRQIDEAELLARVRRRVIVEVGLAAALIVVAAWSVLAHRRALRIRMLDTDLARAQLSALQAQLQPHFLFNVLNNVGELMHTNIAAAEAMLHRLAHLLRYSLTTRNGVTVPLWRDLEIVRAYVDIERVRCGDRITFDYDVGSAPASAMVPPLLLQPLVENSIRHGLADACSAGHIRVSAAAVDGRLSLVVEDNGRGLVDGAQPGHGIGLGGTRERLARLYGRDHALIVHSTPAAGTRITIDIPLVIGSESPADVQATAPAAGAGGATATPR
jgi:hypothetical protein